MILLGEQLMETAHPGQANSNQLHELSYNKTSW